MSASFNKQLQLLSKIGCLLLSAAYLHSLKSALHCDKSIAYIRALRIIMRFALRDRQSILSKMLYPLTSVALN